MGYSLFSIELFSYYLRYLYSIISPLLSLNFSYTALFKLNKKMLIDISKSPEYNPSSMIKFISSLVKYVFPL